ncbi:MAG: YIP1 family protein [Calditrichaeota bacterium]|nr:MAG: YIP1 family protein [Calditrichota bacterium]
MSEEKNVSVEETSSMSFAAKFIGVITSPVATFAEIVKSPTWFLPLLLAVIVTMGITYQMVPMIVEMTAEEMQKNPNMTEEAMEQALSYVEIASPLMPLVTVPIWSVIVAALMLLIGGLFMGGSSSFKTLFCVANWTAPVMIVTGLIGMGLRMITGAMESATSLIFLAPEAERDSAIYFLLTQIDLMAIWYFAILGIGFAAAFKFTTQKGLVTTFLSWGVVILAITAIKAAF